jgi:hypothetical protein
MTRARAKKEGYEPDWRINPNWKTPKKLKTRFVLPDNDDQSDDNDSPIQRASVLGAPQRVPSPVKIRIPAKLPNQTAHHVGQSSASTTTLPESSTIRANVAQKSVNLGSPVRVRPRTTKPHSTADKENSPSAAMLNTWTASGKSAIPKTPGPASRATPLALSPSSVNTMPRPPVVKALTTPMRIQNPHTPGRTLGSARRVPLTIEKKKAMGYRLDPIADVPCPESHREVSYRVNPLRPTSPVKPTPGRQNTKSSVRPTSFAAKADKDIPAASQKPFNLHQKPRVTSSGLAAVEEQLTPDTSRWLPLKTVPNFQRPYTKVSDPPTRPAKPSHEPPRPVTKRDFYVDESLSVPLRADDKSSKRISSSIPKFPIRRRSVSESSTPTGTFTPQGRVTSSPIHFDSLEELKPVDRTEKWKTPMKGRVQNSEQTVRRVCFRTPSMGHVEAKEIPRSRPRPQSILTFATPRRTDKDNPNISTTPVTPQSPSSPKVFDLSDAEDPSFDLFAPQKLKGTRVLETGFIDVGHDVPVPVIDEPENIPSLTTATADACTIPAPVFDLFVPKRSSMKPTAPTLNPADVASAPRSLHIPKGPVRPPTRHRDISVPIKEDQYELTVKPKIAVEPKISAATSVKPTRNDKEVQRPLLGVVAFVDVRTADGDDASAPFADALKNLGARVVKQWTWNGDELDKVGITHVIFKQGGPRTLSKVKWAKGAVKCVGLGWISRYRSLPQLIQM